MIGDVLSVVSVGRLAFLLAVSLLLIPLCCFGSGEDEFRSTRNGRRRCWGYESWCTAEKKRAWVADPVCDGDSLGWARTKAQQRETFYSQADFGYVAGKRKTLSSYCVPRRRNRRQDGRSASTSWLECTDHLHFCRGNGINLDLRSVASRTDNLLYKMDVLGPGDIRGDCVLNEEKLTQNADEISPLQSWGPELRNFVGVDDPNFDQNCDVTFDRPVYVMKLDAEVNMYHHFCDFLNLYASLHVNNDESESQAAWTKDVQVLLWQSIPYRSNFGLAWQAFTEHPLLTLRDLSGKRACFRAGVVFPLLPRMIFGLYYNTPLVPGCRGSGLFKAFNRFMLDGMLPMLSLTGDEAEAEGESRTLAAGRFGPDDPVRVSFLSRQTKHRRVVNEQELLAVLRDDETLTGRVAVTRADFTFQTSFQAQVELMRRTDLLIGLHGSGLTHALFLPDWAAVFELYNCGDADCYADLARLRGVRYLTWPVESYLSSSSSSAVGRGVTRERDTGDADADAGQYSGHEKFANYSFDPSTFKRIVKDAVDAVLADRAAYAAAESVAVNSVAVSSGADDDDNGERNDRIVTSRPLMHGSRSDEL